MHICLTQSRTDVKKLAAAFTLWKAWDRCVSMYEVLMVSPSSDACKNM